MDGGAPDALSFDGLNEKECEILQRSLPKSESHPAFRGSRADRITRPGEGEEAQQEETIVCSAPID